MDKDNLDLESLLAHFNAEQFVSPQKDVLQKLLVALFFMAVGVILVATGFISLLLRLLGLVYFPVAQMKQRIKRQGAMDKSRLHQIRPS